MTKTINNLEPGKIIKKLKENNKVNKYKIDSKLTTKYHNKISHIYNYDKTSPRLFTFLAHDIIDDIIMDILNDINEYLEENLNIDNIKFTEKNTEKYTKYLQSLKDSINQSEIKLLKWANTEFMDLVEYINATLYIADEDKFIRFMKITKNHKKNIEKIKNTYDNKFYIIHIIQSFTDFKDKLLKNKFIGFDNKFKKKLFKYINNADSDQWEMDVDDENQQLSLINTIKNNKFKFENKTTLTKRAKENNYVEVLNKKTSETLIGENLNE